MKLVLGCSYTDTDGAIWHDHLFNEPFRVFAKGGVDNAWITRTGFHVLAERKKYNYDSVFVLFTGLNRTSIAIPSDVEEDFYYSFPLGYDYGPYSDVHLVQSGGPVGLWNEEYFGAGRSLFKNIYASETKNFFSQLNMYHIIMFLNYLEAQKIPYKYTFAYDITKDYPKEQSFGLCTDYLGQLNLEHYIHETPYEFALKQKNGFRDDNFHLTDECQISWANEIKQYLN